MKKPNTIQPTKCDCKKKKLVSPGKQLERLKKLKEVRNQNQPVLNWMWVRQLQRGKEDDKTLRSLCSRERDNSLGV